MLSPNIGGFWQYFILFWQFVKGVIFDVVAHFIFDKKILSPGE
jgi:hypothetical protein